MDAEVPEGIEVNSVRGSQRWLLDQCIGATNLDEDRKHIEKDEAVSGQDFERAAQLRDQAYQLSGIR